MGAGCRVSVKADLSTSDTRYPTPTFHRMAGRPRLLPSVKGKQRLRSSLRACGFTSTLCVRAIKRVLLAAFSNAHTLKRVFSGFTLTLDRLRNLDPLAPSVVKPGRGSHSIVDCGFRIAERHLSSIRNTKSAIRNYKELLSLGRNSMRPRASLDFTVPMLISSVAAISS